MNIDMNPEVKKYYQKSKESLPEGNDTLGKKIIEQVTMRDGIKLSTAIYFPNHGEKWPVLFTRNPYPNNKPLLEAIYLPFVEHGYCLVIQDCRGTGDSEGNWEPFTNEREDGIDSLKWLSKQKWMNGNIGTFGRSYSCFTQWIVADQMPEEVKTMFLDVYGVDRYSQVYMNGMFREDIYTSWAFANSGVKSELSTGELYKRALKILPANKRDKKLLGKTLPFYQHYITEVAENSPYWKDSIWQILKEMPQKVKIPVAISDGWADHHLDGSILGFESLSKETQSKSRLIIGPWDHLQNTTGDMSYPGNDKFGLMNVGAYLSWFDYQLKGNGNGLESQVYIIGKNTWQTIKDWPPSASGAKMSLSPEKQLVNENSKDGKIAFKYDPQNPLITNGGSALLAWITPGFTNLPHGTVRQKDYSERQDVVTFSSDVLNKPVTIMGKTTVNLVVSTSAEDTAFFVRMLEKKADGSIYNVADGISSISYRNHAVKPMPYKPFDKVGLTITLWDTAWEFQKGSQIQLLVSSSNFPMYNIHSNTKGPWAEKGTSSVIAEQTIYCGNSGSNIILSIISE